MSELTEVIQTDLLMGAMKKDRYRVRLKPRMISNCFSTAWVSHCAKQEPEPEQEWGGRLSQARAREQERAGRLSHLAFQSSHSTRPRPNASLQKLLMERIPTTLDTKIVYVVPSIVQWDKIVPYPPCSELLVCVLYLSFSSAPRKAHSWVIDIMSTPISFCFDRSLTLPGSCLIFY